MHKIATTTLAAATIVSSTILGATAATAAPPTPVKQRIEAKAFSADALTGLPNQIINVSAYVGHTVSQRGNRVNWVKGITHLEKRKGGGTSVGCSYGGPSIYASLVSTHIAFRFKDSRGKSFSVATSMRCEKDGWMQTHEIPVHKRKTPVLAPGAKWTATIKIDRAGARDIHGTVGGTLRRK